MASAPRAHREPHITEIHGQQLHDDYFWMRDRERPELLSYLAAENAYAEAALAHTAELRERLLAELRARVQEDDRSAPARKGHFFYYQRLEAGRQYPIFCRSPLDAPEAEQVLLDVNALAEGHDFCELGACQVSPDGRLLAYSVNLAGGEVFTLYIKDLERGALLPEQIGNCHTDVAWASDSRTLFYTTLDATFRPYRLYRHRAGADPADDALVFEEPDGSYFLDLRRSRSGQYILLGVEASKTSELRYCRADAPEEPLRTLAPRRHGHEYRVDHQGEQFLIVTNDAGPNFRLVAAPVADPAEASWRELVPQRADVLIESAAAFADFIALHERHGGLQRLRFLSPDGAPLGAVAFPEAAYGIEPGENLEYATDSYRFVYSSPVTPETVVDYRVGGDGEGAGAWAEVKREEVPGYDRARYRVERLEATAPDGARVPITLLYRADRPRDGRGPLLLHGYGAYGYTLEPDFNANRLSLLDRGWAYAVAHVRGGAELGRAWYEQGRLLQKRNSFADFIACAEQLIAEGITSPETLAIIGTSAGGLLVSAALTQRPELFHSAVARVPFVDVINSMLDPTLPLTVNEWEQWGDPRKPEHFAYMRSYSPYDNVHPARYPHLLITAGLNDPRVCVHEPAKWAARLRATRQGSEDRLLLLRTNMGAGHAGASGRFDFLREVAFEYAFLLEALGRP